MSAQTVWKFPVPIEDDFLISLPRGATVLTVDVQRGEVFVWALCNPTEPTEPRHFRLCGTGHPIETRAGPYVGSFQLLCGELVYHLFEMRYER